MTGRRPATLLALVLLLCLVAAGQATLGAPVPPWRSDVDGGAGRTAPSQPAAPALRPLSAGETISVLPATQTVAAFQTFAVDVVATSATTLGGFEFTLTFNPAIVVAQSATLGSFLGSTGRTALMPPQSPLVDNAVGRITVAGYSFGSQPGASGNGTLARVTYRAIAPGMSPIALSSDGTYPLDLVDPSGASGPPGSTVGAQVTVTAAAPTPGVPQGSLRFINPVRVLDTRPNDPVQQIVTIGVRPDGSPVLPGPLNPGEIGQYLVAGQTFAGTTIPTDTTGVLVNVTIVPDGPLQNPQPGRNAVTVLAGDVASPPNALTVPLNPGIPISFNLWATSLPISGPNRGTLRVVTTDRVHVVLDVVGYYSLTAPVSAGNLRFIPPVRVVDTRPNDPVQQITTIGYNPDGTPISPTPLQADTPRFFKVGGQTFSGVTIPPDATGLLAHITNVQDAASGGFITVFPGDGTRPFASNLNPVTTIAFNSLLVGMPPVGSAGGGTIGVFSKNGSHVAIDVIGYFSPSNPDPGVVSLLTPLRVLDTRGTAGGPIGFTATGAPITAGPITPRTVQRFKVAGQTFGGVQVPTDAKAVVANVMLVGPVSGGFVTLLPGDAPNARPNTSTANPVTPAAAAFWANLVPGDGTVGIYLEADSPRDVVIDLIGYIR